MDNDQPRRPEIRIRRSPQPPLSPAGDETVVQETHPGTQRSPIIDYLRSNLFRKRGQLQASEDAVEVVGPEIVAPETSLASEEGATAEVAMSPLSPEAIRARDSLRLRLGRADIVDSGSIAGLFADANTLVSERVLNDPEIHQIRRRVLEVLGEITAENDPSLRLGEKQNRDYRRNNLKRNLESYINTQRQIAHQNPPIANSIRGVLVRGSIFLGLSEIPGLNILNGRPVTEMIEEMRAAGIDNSQPSIIQNLAEEQTLPAVPEVPTPTPVPIAPEVVSGDNNNQTAGVPENNQPESTEQRIAKKRAFRPILYDYLTRNSNIIKKHFTDNVRPEQGLEWWESAYGVNFRDSMNTPYLEHRNLAFFRELLGAMTNFIDDNSELVEEYRYPIGSILRRSLGVVLRAQGWILPEPEPGVSRSEFLATPDILNWREVDDIRDRIMRGEDVDLNLLRKP